MLLAQTYITDAGQAAYRYQWSQRLRLKLHSQARPKSEPTRVRLLLSKTPTFNQRFLDFPMLCIRT